MSENLEKLTTELPNPHSLDLDLLSTEDMIRVFNSEDASVAQAVAEVIPNIAAAVDQIAARLAQGGRLHYFGAGTSGRLGVLDASECPPTFGVDSSLIQGHIAGGLSALTRSSEGAEDDESLGYADALSAELGRNDCTVAIAASGRTPYAIGALKAARDAGALTVALVCNRPTPMHSVADIVIDPIVGSEVLSGSTRMKSGTAQKMVLNMISTGVMVRLGKTYGNLMVAVRASNEKLKARARRLTIEVLGTADGVDQALESCGYDVRTACVMVRLGVDVKVAGQILEQSAGSLRKALDNKEILP